MNNNNNNANEYAAIPWDLIRGICELHHPNPIMIVTTNGGLEDSLVQGGRIVYSYVTPTDFLIISESEVVASHFFILFGGVILPPPPLIPLDMVDLTGEEELIDLTTGAGGGVGAVNSVVIEIDITTDNDSAVIDIFLFYIQLAFILLFHFIYSRKSNFCCRLSH
ncbi:uncharacterized protein [Onthophagus taurus]|uniref:uncharacterized protein isoform X1 n=1 Tax=Onthophagus taurus TaxID=166361 RepID=UPI0039BE3736